MKSIYKEAILEKRAVLIAELEMLEDILRSAEWKRSSSKSKSGGELASCKEEEEE